MTFLERAFKVFSRIRAGAVKGQNSRIRAGAVKGQNSRIRAGANAQKEIIDKLMNESELRGELKAKNIELKGTQNELKFKEKELALNQKVKDLEIEAIDGMYCQEKVKAMHYMQMLTVRGLIELYETKFQKEIKMKRVSRAEKWKQHLSKAPERFKTFQATGLDIDEVSGQIEGIFNSQSSQIHSIPDHSGGFVIQAKGKLTDQQVKVIQVIIDNTEAKGSVKIV